MKNRQSHTISYDQEKGSMRTYHAHVRNLSRVMTKRKPDTRTEAAAPISTKNLSADQKTALDIVADAEHASGQERENLTRKIEELGGSAKSKAGKDSA